MLIDSLDNKSKLSVDFSLIIPAMKLFGFLSSFNNFTIDGISKAKTSTNKDINTAVAPIACGISKHTMPS